MHVELIMAKNVLEKYLRYWYLRYEIVSIWNGSRNVSLF